MSLLYIIYIPTKLPTNLHVCLSTAPTYLPTSLFVCLSVYQSLPPTAEQCTPWRISINLYIDISQKKKERNRLDWLNFIQWCCFGVLANRKSNIEYIYSCAYFKNKAKWEEEPLCELLWSISVPSAKTNTNSCYCLNVSTKHHTNQSNHSITICICKTPDTDGN